MAETLDIFDENFRLIGSASRDEVHAKGYWHQCFHCWFMRRDRGRDYILFQKRSALKQVFPNMLDITAAGHLEAGETPADGIREIQEELGVAVQFEDLISLGVQCDVGLIGDIIDHEFSHVFLYPCDLPLDAYQLQADEVSALVEMEVQDMIRLFAGEVEQVSVSGYTIDERGEKQPITMMVSEHEIAPHIGRYYLKLGIAIQRYWQGEKHLAI